MRCLKHSWLIFLLLGPWAATRSFAVEASEKARLSVAEAVALALERNPQVLIARAKTGALQG